MEQDLLDLQDRKVTPDQLVLPVRQEAPVVMEPMEIKDRRVNKVIQLLVIKDRKEIQDLLDQPVPMVTMVPPVIRDRKVKRVLQVHKVIL